MKEITFGKYKGKTFKEVRQKDSQYLLWLYKQKIEVSHSDLYLYINTHLNKIKKCALKEYIKFRDERCGGETSIEY